MIEVFQKDVFKETINAHHYCMPVVKEEYDLLALNDVQKVNIFTRLIKSINYLIWGDV